MNYSACASNPDQNVAIASLTTSISTKPRGEVHRKTGQVAAADRCLVDPPRGSRLGEQTNDNENNTAAAVLWQLRSSMVRSCSWAAVLGKAQHEGQSGERKALRDLTQNLPETHTHIAT